MGKYQGGSILLHPTVYLLLVISSLQLCLLISPLCTHPYLYIHWLPQLFKHLQFFHANNSYKIEHYHNKIHQITQNILSQGLQPKLSLL